MGRSEEAVVGRGSVRWGGRAGPGGGRGAPWQGDTEGAVGRWGSPGEDLRGLCWVGALWLRSPVERVAEEHRARGRTGEHWRVYPGVG